jgi:xanthine dehydrogenase accessory factor
VKDAVAIFSAASALRARRAPFLLATVVRIKGSSYRRPGARLIATSEGRVAGSISGGCLERDLLRSGFWRARHGPVVVRYDSRDPDEGSPVLGCGGVVDVLLEQGTAGDEDDPIALLVDAIASNRPTALATVFETTDPAIRLGARWVVQRGDAPVDLESAGSKVLVTERATCFETPTQQGRVEVLVEPILPVPHLFIFGAGPDVLPLANMARQLGWKLTIWGTRAIAPGAAFERDLEVIRAHIDASHSAIAVIMGHNIGRDREALGAALASRAIYIGVLGPLRRTAELASDLSCDVFSDPRVHAPVGLDLGAETPEEIALSIASEILARIRRAGSAPLRLRDRIHGDAP